MYINCSDHPALEIPSRLVFFPLGFGVGALWINCYGDKMQVPTTLVTLTA